MVLQAPEGKSVESLRDFVMFLLSVLFGWGGNLLSLYNGESS